MPPEPADDPDTSPVDSVDVELDDIEDVGPLDADSSIPEEVVATGVPPELDVELVDPPEASGPQAASVTSVTARRLRVRLNNRSRSSPDCRSHCGNRTAPNETRNR